MKIVNSGLKKPWTEYTHFSRNYIKGTQYLYSTGYAAGLIDVEIVELTQKREGADTVYANFISGPLKGKEVAIGNCGHLIEITPDLKEQIRLEEERLNPPPITLTGNGLANRFKMYDP